jgi:hypothetical protein
MKKRKVSLNENLQIDSFKPLLEKYRDYTSIMRDIKLTCLLGQRVQFDIENINPPISVHQYDQKYLIDVGWMKEIKVHSIKFIVNTDLIVEEIELSYDGEIYNGWDVIPRVMGEYKNGNHNVEIWGFKVENLNK